MQVLSYFPGQQARLFLETFGSDGYRADGYLAPTVTHIYKPDFTLMDGYAHVMTKLSTGLYYYSFTLPTGAASIGNYLVDITYLDPITSMLHEIAYQIIVTAPYGNFSATIG